MGSQTQLSQYRNRITLPILTAFNYLLSVSSDILMTGTFSKFLRILADRR